MFVCPTEITAFSDRHADFEKLNTEILGVSTDSVLHSRGRRSLLLSVSLVLSPFLASPSLRLSRSESPTLSANRKPARRSRGGNGCKVGDDNGSLMLMWEDGFCCPWVAECLEEIDGEDPVRKAFSKMSIQLYNYGEGWVDGEGCF
ncbi:uncharacterized protein LOC143863918 isoform X2 [Tasmannia lanceolata]|uniref:uncharacterized protein LOC143863918 isoform X2 n=1 Tax=Tasmannia lanceolata TaxID=3420 RepID=UPI004064C6F7